MMIFKLQTQLLVVFLRERNEQERIAPSRPDFTVGFLDALTAMEQLGGIKQRAKNRWRVPCEAKEHHTITIKAVLLAKK